MRHSVKIESEHDITGRGKVLAVNRSAFDFNIGDVVNDKWIITGIESAAQLTHPVRYPSKCGLIVKQIEI